MAWELLKFINTIGEDRQKAVFKPYGQTARKLSRSSYNSKLRRFEKYGLLKRQQQGHFYLFSLTEKAKKFHQQPAVRNLRTDGLQSLIIFDVPQTKKRERDILRRSLIKNGFLGIRESCFISAYEISEDLKELIKEMHLENNVTVFYGRIVPLAVKK